MVNDHQEEEEIYGAWKNMFGVQICTWAPFGRPLPSFHGKKTKAAAWPKNMVVTRGTDSLGMQ